MTKQQTEGVDAKQYVTDYNKTMADVETGLLYDRVEAGMAVTDAYEIPDPDMAHASDKGQPPEKK